MKAELIAVGTEILTGQITNTNAQFLSEKLADPQAKVGGMIGHAPFYPLTCKSSDIIAAEE